MKKLISEQLPNDGGYHIKRLVDEANGRLDQIGRRGKRAKIVAKKTSLSLQFNFNDGNGNPQKNVGLGAITFSAKGIEEAERTAAMVTNQLAANIFTWDWFNALIGKDTSEKTKVLTCKEMIEEYKKHYFKQREGNKTPKNSWKRECGRIETILGDKEKPLSLFLVRQIIEHTNNNTDARTKTLRGLVGFLKYFGNTDYKEVIKEYKANNNPKPKKRDVPSDQKIIELYQDGFKPKPRTTKARLYRLPQWQFLYGLLATYGLRVHEAWNIANWDKPVTLKNGDWVTVDINEDKEISVQRHAGDMVIPAILDPNNKEYILCIKHSTKTGYRMAMPLSPEGCDWIKEFNLIQELNLPDVKIPLRRVGTDEDTYECTRATCQWFRSRKYGFTPHDLRHAFNHRGHRLGINVDTLCQTLGHGYEMNTTTYRNSKGEQAKFQNLRAAISKDQEKRAKLELLKEENEALKTENKDLKNENKLLKTKLKMYEAIEESRGQK
jgi:integrase